MIYTFKHKQLSLRAFQNNYLISSQLERVELTEALCFISAGVTLGDFAPKTALALLGTRVGLVVTTAAQLACHCLLGGRILSLLFCIFLYVEHKVAVVPHNQYILSITLYNYSFC